MPAPDCTRSPGTARPAPSRHTVSPTAIASISPIVPPRGAVMVSECLPIGSGCDRSPPWAVTNARKWSIAEPSRNVCAGSTPSRPAASSISTASASVSSTTSGGPPPASTSSDSSTSTALPTVRPSGRDMSVSSARVTSPCSVPSSTIVRASSRDSASVLRNAPDPTLESSTNARAPSAIFLLITELAISGSDSVVPVTSRSA